MQRHLQVHTVGGIVADALTPGATNIQARWRPMHQGHPVPLMPAPDWRCSHQELGRTPLSAASGREAPPHHPAPAPESTGQPVVSPPQHCTAGTWTRYPGRRDRPIRTGHQRHRHEAPSLRKLEAHDGRAPGTSGQPPGSAWSPTAAPGTLLAPPTSSRIRPRPAACTPSAPPGVDIPSAQEGSRAALQFPLPATRRAQMAAFSDPARDPGAITTRLSPRRTSRQAPRTPQARPGTDQPTREMPARSARRGDSLRRGRAC